MRQTDLPEHRKITPSAVPEGLKPARPIPDYTKQIRLAHETFEAQKGDMRATCEILRGHKLFKGEAVAPHIVTNMIENYKRLQRPAKPGMGKKKSHGKISPNLRASPDRAEALRCKAEEAQLRREEKARQQQEMLQTTLDTVWQNRRERSPIKAAAEALDVTYGTICMHIQKIKKRADMTPADWPEGQPFDLKAELKEAKEHARLASGTPEEPGQRYAILQATLDALWENRYDRGPRAATAKFLHVTPITVTHRLKQVEQIPDMTPTGWPEGQPFNLRAEMKKAKEEKARKNAEVQKARVRERQTAKAQKKAQKKEVRQKTAVTSPRPAFDTASARQAIAMNGTAEVNRYGFMPPRRGPHPDRYTATLEGLAAKQIFNSHAAAAAALGISPFGLAGRVAPEKLEAQGIDKDWDLLTLKQKIAEARGIPVERLRLGTDFMAAADGNGKSPATASAVATRNPAEQADRRKAFQTHVPLMNRP